MTGAAETKTHTVGCAVRTMREAQLFVWNGAHGAPYRKACSLDEVKRNPGMRTYATPDSISFHPGYIE